MLDLAARICILALLIAFILYRANIPLLTGAKEIEEFKYVPKLQLDASGKFYFAPNPKKMRLNSKNMLYYSNIEYIGNVTIIFSEFGE